MKKVWSTYHFVTNQLIIVLSKHISMWFSERKTTHFIIHKEKSIQLDRVHNSVNGTCFICKPSLQTCLFSERSVRKQCVSLTQNQTNLMDEHAWSKQKLDWHHCWFKTQLEKSLKTKQKKITRLHTWYTHEWHVWGSWRPEPA